MTRRERIEILLEYLVDVREGLPEKEPTSQDEMLALMCKAWNDPSYQELERLLPYLKQNHPRHYWHLAERYLRYGEVRVAWCSKCGSHHASAIGKVHRHPPGRTITLQPRIIRTVNRSIDPTNITLALDFLEQHFRVDPFLPKAVVMVETSRRLRNVA